MIFYELRRGLAAAAVGLALATISCDDPVGPSDPVFLDLGEPRDGSLPGNGVQADTVWFTLPEDREVGVLLETDGPTAITVIDPTGAEREHGWVPEGRYPFHFDDAPAGDWAIILRSFEERDDDIDYSISVVAVDPLPEQTSPVLPADTIIDDEGFETGFDYDEFVLTTADGEYLNIFLQGELTNWFADLGLYGPDGLVQFSWKGDDPVRGRYSGRLVLEENTEYRLVVRAPGISMEPMDYRLEIYRTDPAPENASAQLERDVTASEQIDDAGDFDTFTFEGASGDIIDVLLGGAGRLTARIYDPNGLQVGIVETALSTLNPATTGFITLSEGGIYEVQVSAFAEERGNAYTLLLHPVDPAPEHSVPVLVAGDSATEELIDPPSDFDRFMVTGPDSGSIAIAVVRSVDVPGSLRVRVIPPDSNTEAYTTVLRPQNPDEIIGRIPAGSYTLEVLSYVSSYEDGHFVWPYDVYTSWSTDNPETVTPVLHFGESVEETAQPLTDVDRFTFGVSARSHFRVEIEAFGEEGYDEIGAYIGPIGAPPLAIVSVESGADAPTLSRRITATEAGVFGIGIELGRLTSSWSRNGSYRLGLSAYPTVVEHAPATLSVGDSVTDAMDEIGDVDRYLITGTANQPVVIGLRLATGTTGLILAEAFYDDQPDSVTAVVSSAQLVPETSAQLDADGRLVIEVLEFPLGFGLHGTGPYELYVTEVPSPTRGR